MNIQFTVMGHGLEKAAAIEKALKDIGAPFEAKMALSRANGKTHTKTKITKAIVLAVENEIATHPSRSISDIARATNVSTATIGRIKKGIHTLQTGDDNAES